MTKMETNKPNEDEKLSGRGILLRSDPKPSSKTVLEVRPLLRSHDSETDEESD